MAEPKRKAEQSDPVILSIFNHRLDALKANEHFTIPIEDANRLNLRSIRSLLSQANHKYGTNYRLHTTPTHLWVWYDPTPRGTTTPSNPLLQLLATGTPQERAKALQELASTTPLSAKTRSPGSSYCTLDETLDLLRIDAEVWATIPPLRQTQLRIETGMILRNRRRETRKEQKRTKAYTSLADHFGLTHPTPPAIQAEKERQGGTIQAEEEAA